tara:strand:+ start:361 stop:627 length:267 start_codon:yes stop_codon:yes gene_type:complete
MSTGLNMQTDRQLRYSNREQKQKIQQQNIDRANRLEKRRCNIINKVDKEVTNEIMEDIATEIDAITIKKQHFEHRYPTRISTKNSFFL